MVDDDAERAVTELQGPSPSSSCRSDTGIGDPDAAVVVYAFEERYEVKKRLGEGGMGEVRLCRDRMIGREVAMKVVLPSMTGGAEMQAPASTLDPRSGLPERDIPPELEAVCVRACATKRAERYRPARRTTSARWRFRELGRAIALTPDDPEALAPLVRLLTQPPKAAAGGPRDHRSRCAWLAAGEMPRIALAYSASWLIFFPLQVAMASATGSSRRGSRGSRWPRPRCSTVRSS